jgi:hypothetical protein
MTKSLYLFVSVLAGASLLMSCKSSFPNEVQTGQLPFQNLSRYEISVGGIPVIKSEHAYRSDYGVILDTTYYTNSVFRVNMIITDTLERCDTIQRADTIRLCHYFPGPELSHGSGELSWYSFGLHKIEFNIDTFSKKLRHIAFLNQTQTGQTYPTQGGSDENTSDVGIEFTELDMSYSQVQDTIIAEAHGSNIKFKDKSVNDYNNSRWGGSVIGGWDNKGIFSIPNPLPDSAYVRIKLVSKP